MSPSRAIAVLLLASSCAAAEPSPDPVRTWRIDDGTTGMLVEDHRVPLVSVRIELAAGTYSPWVTKSHAEEAFESQMRDSKAALRRRADELAADVDLSVGKRASTLALTCRTEDLGAALALVRDILTNRDFERADLVRRGREARLGWAASLKEPQFVLWQAAARILYHEDDPRREPYEAPPPISTDLGKLADARDVLVRLPGRVIGFAGDLTQDEAKRSAADLLPPVGESPPDLAPSFGPIAKAGSRPAAQVLKLPRLTQVYFAYARDSLNYADPDRVACEMANEVLGGHFGSRLMVALRQEGGETYGAGSFDGGDTEPGPYGLYTYTRTDNAAKTEEKFRAVLRKFHDDGITEEERADTVGYLLGRRAFARQSPAQILATAMWERRLGLPRNFLDDMAEKASRLTLDEVNAFISRFYDPAQFTMLELESK